MTRILNVRDWNSDGDWLFGLNVATDFFGLSKRVP